MYIIVTYFNCFSTDLNVTRYSCTANNTNVNQCTTDWLDLENKVTIQKLFEARVHLGHKCGVWNPLMNPYIYGIRSGLHIFDLNKTYINLKLALTIVGHIAAKGGIILFINERTQFDRLARVTAEQCGEYCVSPKWRPGTLTNSHMLLGTLKLPDLMIFLSTVPSSTALQEAAMTNIPTIGLVDSDSNPHLVTYPVPGNDDTPTSVSFYCQIICDIINLAKQKTIKSSL